MSGIIAQAGMFGRRVATDFGAASRAFDSSLSQDIEIPDNDAFSFGDSVNDSPFSLAMWVKINSGGRVAFTKYIDHSPFRGEWSINTQESNIFFQCLDDYATKRVKRDSSVGVTANTWAHVVGTYDGSAADSGITLYKNGSAVASTPQGEDGGYVAMHNRDSPVSIGSSLKNSTYAKYSDGKIADARIYSSALTSAQVASLAAGTNVTANLVARWIGNDDISGGVVPDLSGNGYDGTNNGSTYSTDGPLD